MLSTLAMSHIFHSLPPCDESLVVCLVTSSRHAQLFFGGFFFGGGGGSCFSASFLTTTSELYRVVTALSSHLLIVREREMRVTCKELCLP